MKNPLSFLSRKSLETSLGTLQSRFPIPSILVLVIAALFFYIVNAESESVVLLRVVLSLIVTFFLSIGTTLLLESGRKQHKIWHVAPLIYGVLFYLTLNPLTNGWMIDSITYFLLHLVGFISLIFFAPYWENLFYKKERSVEYTNYFSRTAWTLFMSWIVGGSLVALGFIALSSVENLFDLSSFVSRHNLYENWAVISLALMAPLYCLTQLSRVSDVEKRNYEINRFFSFLIRFIATPFIVIYFVILYAYSAKVLLNFQDWPKGMISWMVVGFSVFGYLTYIFSKPYEDNAMIALFRKFFPFVVPVQVLMLGYAIYLRIDQYGLTMNRYFVVIFGIWLALISLYYIASKRKSLTVIAATLTAIALIISVGPWSVYQLPLSRQYDRLMKNLEVAGMIQDGVITKKPAELDVSLENNIYSEIEYICGYSQCEKIKTLFAQQLTGAEEKYAKKWSESDYNEGAYPGMSNWEIVNEVTTSLDISYRQGEFGVSSKYVSLGGKNSFDETVIFPLDTTGYNRVLRVYNKKEGIDLGKKEYIMIDPDTETLTLYNAGAGEKSISLKEFNETLRAKYKNTSNMNVESGDLTTTLQSGNITIKLILQGYGYLNPSFTPTDRNDEYLHISGYALMR